MRTKNINKSLHHRVTSEEMFTEDETVKLAVVAAVRSVCAEYTESFV